jgi:hypothetical protein
MTGQTGNVESRRVSRLYGAFPMRVRGVDANGKAFDATSIADNLCADGLYFQLPRAQARGARLFTVIRLTCGLSIAAWGHVLRRESVDHGLSGIAVRFARTRLLSVTEVC